MISMVEKINRLRIKGCDLQLEHMLSELTEHRKDFLESPEILDFERKWVGEYIK